MTHFTWNFGEALTCHVFHPPQNAGEVDAEMGGSKSSAEKVAETLTFEGVEVGLS